MPEYTPERFSVNAVESLFKIDKVLACSIPGTAPGSALR